MLKPAWRAVCAVTNRLCRLSSGQNRPLGRKPFHPHLLSQRAGSGVWWGETAQRVRNARCKRRKFRAAKEFPLGLRSVR